MSKTTEQLLKEINETEKFANIDLDTVSWQSRPGMAAAKREASDKLAPLRTEYTNRIRANSLGIFVFGTADEQKQFADIAAEEAGTLTLYANEAYDFLAAAVEPTLGPSREFGVQQQAVLSGTLREYTKQFDVIDMIRPQLQDLVVVKDAAGTRDQVKLMVRRAVGDELLRVVLNHQMTTKSLATGFSGSILPVVILGAEPDEVPGLASLFTNTSSVQAGTTEDGITKEFVLKQFSFIKSKLKKTKNNQ